MTDRSALTWIKLLLRDRAGNTLAMIAAALIPLLAMVGGGIDMGRSYLSQSRLQQACDSGVLAARKKLGSQVVTTGIIPGDVAAAGDRFFNLNYRNGAYGTEGRSFQMTLEKDFAISGTASVSVPTTIMTLFGYSAMPIQVTCEARLNFSNTDVMFVLDTTGSMAETNPGDSEPKINVMRHVVQGFYTQLETSKTAGTRIRYGFVPYSTNVNVGALLDPDWMVKKWKYQSREQVPVGTQTGTTTYYRNWVYMSGSQTPWTQTDSYPGTWHPPVSWSNPGSTTIDANENVVVIPPSSGTTPGFYSCDRPTPAGTVSYTGTTGTPRDEPFAGPPAGTRHIVPGVVVVNGAQYSTGLTGGTCGVSSTTNTDYTVSYEQVTDPTETTVYKWRYAKLNKDVSNWRNEYNGCIEERSTYEITDYDNVDLSRALDLDIDLIPTNNDDTKWRPMYPNVIYARSLKWDGSGSFTPSAVVTTDEYVAPYWMGTASCPAAARKLDAISPAQLNSYLANLTPTGATYHDIGMIWGGRLLSPTGLFAGDNADIDGKPTSRHMIFLTDGTTQALDVSYSSYGLEPLDRRRWSPGSTLSLSGTVEKRFEVACSEVKKRNITVWVIGFGTTLNPIMTRCAGPGHSFVARDAAELSDAFDKIAAHLGELRVSK